MNDIRSKFSRHFAAFGHKVYLANHSLGRPLDQMRENAERFFAQWDQQMGDAWNDGAWLGEVKKFREQIACLVGLGSYTGVVPKTSAGQGLRAVLNSFPADHCIKVVTTTGEFDSIDFILKTYVQKGRASVVWVEPSEVEGPIKKYSASKIAESILPGTDLVIVSSCYFRTGQILQGIELITARARAVGALSMVDTYHALGVYDFSMTEIGADFVIGGCYKYLRGGPGACFLAMTPDIEVSTMRTLDTGWYAKKDTFGYEREEQAVTKDGGDGWFESTPAVLPFYQSNPGLALTLEVSARAIRRKTLEIQGCLRHAMASADVPVFAPKNDEEWGAFLTVPHTDPPSLCATLKAHGVIVDSRNELVRFGPDLLTTHEEVQKTVDAWGYASVD